MCVFSGFFLTCQFLYCVLAICNLAIFVVATPSSSSRVWGDSCGFIVCCYEAGLQECETLTLQSSCPSEKQTAGARSTWSGCWLSGRRGVCMGLTSSSSSSWPSRTPAAPSRSPRVSSPELDEPNTPGKSASKVGHTLTPWSQDWFARCNLISKPLHVSSVYVCNVLDFE